MADPEGTCHLVGVAARASTLSALVRGRLAPRHSISPADVEEAEILQQAFRKASETIRG